MSISLGKHDRHLTLDALTPFLEEVRRMTGSAADALLDDVGSISLRAIGVDESMTVTDVQKVLIGTGFFPGGRADGICGYRTRAAIRLFQEYVRTVEGRSSLPDGIAGPKTCAELQRWVMDDGKANWSAALIDWNQVRAAPSGGARQKDESAAPESPAGENPFGENPAGENSAVENSAREYPAREFTAREYTAWLQFLETVKRHYQSSPSAMHRQVDSFDDETDTRRVDDWMFSPDDIHLIGVRHDQRDKARVFDDVLVLLIRGLVFVFQGSTDPGHSSNPAGAPFLVHGQHDFRFGQHRGSYHALRPQHFDRHGVLVVRSKDDYVLDASDVDAGLEVNGTINIHWGGKGVHRQVKRWSEGCQVIAGSGYRNHTGSVIDCSGYVGINNTEVKDSRGRRTRGAYTVLSDLIVAMSTDIARAGNIKYMLLNSADLALDPTISERLLADRLAGLALMKKLS